MVSTKTVSLTRYCNMNTASLQKTQAGRELEWWSKWSDELLQRVLVLPVLQYSSAPSFRRLFSVAPLSWMMAPVNFLEPCAIHMGVNLRRRDIRMTQHRLHRAQIGTSFEKMGGKRMAQGMRRYPLLDAGGQRVTANELPESLPRQRPARAVDKHKTAGSILGQSRSADLDVVE